MPNVSGDLCALRLVIWAHPAAAPGRAVGGLGAGRAVPVPMTDDLEGGRPHEALTQGEGVWMEAGLEPLQLCILADETVPVLIPVQISHEFTSTEERNKIDASQHEYSAGAPT